MWVEGCEVRAAAGEIGGPRASGPTSGWQSPPSRSLGDHLPSSDKKNLNIKKNEQLHFSKKNCIEKNPWRNTVPVMRCSWGQDGLLLPCSVTVTIGTDPVDRCVKAVSLRRTGR